MDIGSLIRRAGLHYGEMPCLQEDDRTVSFRDFDRLTDRVGNALLDTGLQQGDRVGVLMPNGIDCLVAYYALAKAGLVRVTLNGRETAEDHAYKLGDSGARALIHAAHLVDVATLDVVLKLDDTQLQAMMATGEDTPCQRPRPLDAPYRLGYTGGTTGKPKGVTLTTRGELAELSAFLVDLVPDLRAGERFLHAAPIAHASGAFFLPAVARGATSVVMAKFDAGGFLDLAASSGATMSFLVPTMLAMIMEAPEPDGAPYRLNRICYGASPIAPALLTRAEARFGRVFAQVYGQAESPMVITCLQPQDHDRTGSCGRPFTCVDVAILDDDDRPLPPGEVGEIVCRGPQLMAGYWNRPEATEQAMRGGWLHTGDVGYCDDDGFFYILDRKNDMLISGGFNVYPREVEDVLLGCDGVVEAAVVGLPDDKWGDRIHAVIAGRDGVDPQAVLQQAKQQLADYKRPRSIELWPELPKSGANKILRRRVREQVVAQLEDPA